MAAVQPVTLTSQLSDVDSLQRELTNRYLLPMLAELEAELTRIRALLDPDLRQRYPAQQDGRLWPIGRCQEISAAVYQHLQHCIQHPENPVHHALQQFVIAGGVAKRIWGALRDQYFQNAFQFGALYVDVSNDTVDPAKPAVEILPLQESGFANITGFHQFARVARQYWQCEIWPNRLLPQLSPFFPLVVFYHTTNQISLQPRGAYMQQLNQQSGFQLAEQFLASSAQVALPPAIDELISDRAQQLEMEVASGADAALRYCQQYRDDPRCSTHPFLLEMLAMRDRLLA